MENDDVAGELGRRTLIGGGAALFAAFVSFGVDPLLLAPPAAAATDYIYPTTSRTVSDTFAAHIARGSVNPGTDYVCSVGTPVVAVRAGTVTFAADWGTAGNTVKVDHGAGVTTEYLHNSRFSVGVGTAVSQGQQISLSGNTGSSTGPHLHISLKFGGKNVDFQKYVGVPTAPPPPPPTIGDRMFVISSPGRGVALVAAGYYRSLSAAGNFEEVNAANQIATASLSLTDGRFDTIRDICTSGSISLRQPDWTGASVYTPKVDLQPATIAAIVAQVKAAL